MRAALGTLSRVTSLFAPAGLASSGGAALPEWKRVADITRADRRRQSGQARRRFETLAATSASNVSSQTRQCHS
jgi:hypothetical protein